MEMNLQQEFTDTDLLKVSGATLSELFGQLASTD